VATLNFSVELLSWPAWLAATDNIGRCDTITPSDRNGRAARPARALVVVLTTRRREIIVELSVERNVMAYSFALARIDQFVLSRLIPSLSYPVEFMERIDHGDDIVHWRLRLHIIQVAEKDTP
jgi:hypothetical protein